MARSPPPLTSIRRDPLRHVRLAAPLDRLLGALPAEASAAPSMMTQDERRLLFNLAQGYYAGEGRIVDAGILLGASSCCFAAGIARNARCGEILARWSRPVVSIERGLASAGTAEFLRRHGVAAGLRPGDSFAALVEQQVAPFRHLVELRIGDIRNTGAVADPVEILFLDVLKLPDISEFALRHYFPRLIAGRSLVIQQDYFIDRLPFIRLHQELFAEYFEYAGEVASSAVFRCLAPVPEAVLQRVFAGKPDADEQLRLAGRAPPRTADPCRRLMLALSDVRMLLRLRGVAAARQRLRQAEREFAAQLMPGGPPRLRQALAAAHALCGGHGFA